MGLIEIINLANVAINWIFWVRRYLIRCVHAVTINPGVTHKSDNPPKGILNPFPWKSDNPLMGIRNLVPSGTMYQCPRGLTVKT